jgi:hypothetical protein
MMDMWHCLDGKGIAMSSSILSAEKGNGQSVTSDVSRPSFYNWPC